MLKKVALKQEPILHIHRYVVTITRQEGIETVRKFHYCVNREEVRKICKRAKAGSYIEVHKAQHNFIQAYVKPKKGE